MNDNIVIPEWHSAAYFRIMEKRKEKKQRATVFAAVMALTILTSFAVGFIAGQYQRQRTVPIHISDAADTIDAGWTNSAVSILGIGNKYSYEELRSLLCSVVDYECGEGTENARRNLEAMGFSEEQMMYFGFPETEGE